nr:DJ-1 family glyoxalase III [Tissierella sp.]
MKIIVFLADGFEEVEALTVVDYLRRVDIEVDMVSITDKIEVKGAHAIEVISDKLLKDLDIKDYQGLVIPGGLPGASNLQASQGVVDFVKDMNQRQALIAAICAGPIVLQEAGVIKDKNFTCYPGFEEKIKDGNHKEENVVVDGNIITSRGPALAVDFTLEIVNYLLGSEKRDELKKDILYK